MKSYPLKRHTWIIAVMIFLITLYALPSYGQSDDPFSKPQPPSDPFGRPASADNPFRNGANPFGRPATPEDPFKNGGDPFTKPVKPGEGADPFGGGTTTTVERDRPNLIIQWADAPQSPTDLRQRIEATLRKPAKIEVIEVPLGSLIKELSEQYDIPINIDRHALADNGIDPSQPITKLIEGISLRSALNIILDPLGLTYIIDFNTLVITTREEEADRMVNRVYPVTDLVRTEAGDTGFTCDTEPLVNAIKGTIGKEHWVDVGGDGIIRSVPTSIGTSLVVLQSRIINETVDSLLQTLHDINKQGLENNRTEESAGKLKTWYDVSSLPPSIQRPATKRMEAALGQSTAIEAIEMPLTDIFEQLAERHGIPIFIDNHALEDQGTDPSAPFTGVLKNVTLRSALNTILKDYELAFTIRNESLLITTSYKIKPITRIYPVTNLIDDETDVESLIHTFTQSIEPRSWKSIDGDGRIAPLRMPGGAVLIVTQSRKTHESLGALLQTLRMVNDTDEKTGKLKPSYAVYVDPKTRQAERRIVEALAKPVKLDITNEPFEDLIFSLGKSLDLPIRIDRRSIKNRGPDPETPVTHRFESIELETAIRIILLPLRLTYYIENGTLMITTPKEESKQVRPRVYPIDDLIHFTDPEGKPLVDSESLTRTIETTVDGGSWIRVGGHGGIDTIKLSQRTVMIVSQTDRNHKAIAELLREIRRTAKPADATETFYHEKKPEKESKPNVSMIM